MSYARQLEVKIRKDVLQDVFRRADQLEAQLNVIADGGAVLGPEEEREMRYLERIATAPPPGDRRSRLTQRIVGVRRQYDELVKSEAARAAYTAADERGDPASMRLSDLPRSIPLQRTADRESTVAHVASFLRPEQGQEDGEDEVRALSAEGRLAQELQRFPVLSVPGTESTLVFRRLDVWTDEDDAEARQRERLAVLQLNQAAANLLEMQQLVQQHVAQDQSQFDTIEQQVGQARASTAEAVVTLTSAKTDTERMLVWLAPAVGLAIVGGGIIAVAPAAAAGCVACVLVRGGVMAGALGFHVLGTVRLKKWQEQAMQSLTEHLPRAFDVLPGPQVSVLVSAGREAERRLLAKLGDSASWSWYAASGAALVKGLSAYRRRSDAREGHAFFTSFTAKGLRASEAIRVVKQLSIAGSIDPGCEVAWTRPVHEEQESTLLRYLIFSNFIGSRDFYCICRCIEVDAPSPEEASAGARRRFAFAVASLQPELLVSAGLPQSNNGMEHGCIHSSGVVVSDDGNGGSLVEVMADVAPGEPWYLPTYLVDTEVRLHVLRTAERLGRELKLAVKAAKAAASDAD